LWVWMGGLVGAGGGGEEGRRQAFHYNPAMPQMRCWKGKGARPSPQPPSPTLPHLPTHWADATDRGP
jgi:hypothetical protein